MTDLNKPFKFLVKVTDEEDILYSCIPAVILKEYLLVSWIEPKGGTCAMEYRREEVAKFIAEGLWVIVGEDNA